MDLKEYVKKYNREENNNFALACIEQNTIGDLENAISDKPDLTDCNNWNITQDEWIDAVETAIFELKKDK